MSDRVALKVPWRDLILITEISTGLRQSYLLLVSTPATPRSLYRYTTFHSGMDAKVSQQGFWPLPWEWAHDDKTMPYKLYVSFKSSCPSCGTLDLSEFNVNVMTGNNGAHQRSPYDPGIQKWPFFFVPTPANIFTSMKLSFASYIMRLHRGKKNSRVWTKKKGHIWIPGS